MPVSIASPLTRSTCAVTAAALLILTASIAGFGAAAQSGAASFSGSLMDAIGRVLPDATIVLVSTLRAGEKHETRSDQSGRFQFAGLPAGDYQVKTRLPGFASEQGRVALKAGQNLQQEVVFQVGSLDGDDHDDREPRRGTADASNPGTEAAAPPRLTGAASRRPAAVSIAAAQDSRCEAAIPAAPVGGGHRRAGQGGRPHRNRRIPERAASPGAG